MSVTSSEIEGSHEFQTNFLCECVLAGTGDNEVEQMQGIAKKSQIQEDKIYACEKQQEIIDYGDG